MTEPPASLVCERHDEPLRWIMGGPAAPAHLGIWQCRRCQVEFCAALDARAQNDPPPPSFCR